MVEHMTQDKIKAGNKLKNGIYTYIYRFSEFLSKYLGLLEASAKQEKTTRSHTWGWLETTPNH